MCMWKHNDEKLTIFLGNYEINFERYFILVEGDNFIVFFAKPLKSDSNKTDLFVAVAEDGKVYEIRVFPQEIYKYTEEDIIEEIIEGGNARIQKLLKKIYEMYDIKFEEVFA